MELFDAQLEAGWQLSLAMGRDPIDLPSSDEEEEEDGNANSNHAPPLERQFEQQRRERLLVSRAHQLTALRDGFWWVLPSPSLLLVVVVSPRATSLPRSMAELHSHLRLLGWSDLQLLLSGASYLSAEMVEDAMRFDALPQGSR